MYIYIYIYLKFRVDDCWDGSRGGVPVESVAWGVDGLAETKRKPSSLRVEYAEPTQRYDILFISSLFCEYINLEYVCIHAIYWVNQAEYVIHMRAAASQEYVNTYSTRRVPIESVACGIDGLAETQKKGRGELAFTRYCFTSSRLCTSQSSFPSSGPPALPTLVQYYCAAIGQYTTSPQPPFNIPYTLQYW